MAQSDVRSLDALVALGEGLDRLTGQLDLALQELSVCTQAIEDWVRSERPVYWKQQTQAAERRLTEALEQLSQTQSSSDPRSRAVASEAKQRVARARQRLKLCQDKRLACRRQAAELERVLMRLAGPVASVGEHARRGLPQAKAELSRLVQILQSYSEQDPSR